MWEQLATIRELQDKWSDNSVSCTITIQNDEGKSLQNAIEFYAAYVKTLSFLPLENHSYLQAPYQTITEEEYKNYREDLKKIRYKKKSQEKLIGSKYCDSDVCAL